MTLFGAYTLQDDHTDPAESYRGFRAATLGTAPSDRIFQPALPGQITQLAFVSQEPVPALRISARRPIVLETWPDLNTQYSAYRQHIAPALGAQEMTTPLLLNFELLGCTMGDPHQFDDVTDGFAVITVWPGQLGTKQVYAVYSQIWPQLFPDTEPLPSGLGAHYGIRVGEHAAFIELWTNPHSWGGVPRNHPARRSPTGYGRL